MLLLLGWVPTMVDAEGMDIVAIRNQEIVRIQVKSTLKRLDGYSYQWQVNKGLQKRSLTEEDCDVVACVALDLRKIVFYPISIISKQITRRMALSKMVAPNLEEDSWETALAAMLKH